MEDVYCKGLLKVDLSRYETEHKILCSNKSGEVCC